MSNVGSHFRIDGLVQERRNSSALAMELRLSCTNPLKCIFLKEDDCILEETPLKIMLKGLVNSWKYVSTGLGNGCDYKE